jgi:hypothetical protein
LTPRIRIPWLRGRYDLSSGSGAAAGRCITHVFL